MAEAGDDVNNNERTIHPYPGKTKSKVWDYFGFYKIKEGPATRQTLDMTRHLPTLSKEIYK